MIILLITIIIILLWNVLVTKVEFYYNSSGFQAKEKKWKNQHEETKILTRTASKYLEVLTLIFFPGLRALLYSPQPMKVAGKVVESSSAPWRGIWVLSHWRCWSIKYYKARIQDAMVVFGPCKDPLQGCLKRFTPNGAGDQVMLGIDTLSNHCTVSQSLIF